MEDDSSTLGRLWPCLRDSGMLVQRRRCIEDSSAVTQADVAELLRQPGPLHALEVRAGAETIAFSLVSLASEAVEPVGQLHGFFSQAGACLETAAELLDRTLQWFDAHGAGLVRQARRDPLSGVLRCEQDRRLIGLLQARGFALGPVAANMQTDAAQFHWTERMCAQAEALAKSGMSLRRGGAADAPAIQALNRREGLPAWDYHVEALQAVSGFDLLHVALHGDELVGYAGFFAARWSTPLPEFGPLLVASSLRGRGIGRVLTARALDFARAQGKRLVRLSTLRFDFYRALGFELTVTWQEQMQRPAPKLPKGLVT
jgi:predicted N-acetyltransferase YhbS